MQCKYLQTGIVESIPISGLLVIYIFEYQRYVQTARFLGMKIITKFNRLIILLITKLYLLYDERKVAPVSFMI